MITPVHKARSPETNVTPYMVYPSLKSHSCPHVAEGTCCSAILKTTSHAAPPVTPNHYHLPLSHQVHQPSIFKTLASLHARAAQTLFWRLPYQMRQQVFRQVRPELAAYYDQLLHGRAGTYSLATMVERGCLFIHIPKCAGIAVSQALFGNRAGKIT